MREDDPTEYSPEFQDEYRRLWHEAAAERDALREAVARLEEIELAAWDIQRGLTPAYQALSDALQVRKPSLEEQP